MSKQILRILRFGCFAMASFTCLAMLAMLLAIVLSLYGAEMAAPTYDYIISAITYLFCTVSMVTCAILCKELETY